VPALRRGQHTHDTSHANMPCVVLVLDDVVCQAAGIQCSIVLLLWHAMSDLIFLVMWFNKPSFTKHGLNVQKPTFKIKRVACNKIYLKAHIQSSLNASDIFLTYYSWLLALYMVWVLRLYTNCDIIVQRSSSYFKVAVVACRCVDELKYQLVVLYLTNVLTCIVVFTIFYLHAKLVNWLICLSPCVVGATCLQIWVVL
jgi:hypothetical protein